MPQDKKLLLKELFQSTVKIGAVAFGGGYGMLPFMEEEFVINRGWISQQEIVEIFAVSQSVPGAIALNTSTFIGYRVAGIPGAILASVGVSIPQFFIISSLSILYLQYQSNSYVNAAFAGISACVVALILSAVLKITQSAVHDIFGLIIAASGFIAITVFRLHAIMCLLIAGIIGWAWTLVRAIRA